MFEGDVMFLVGGDCCHTVVCGAYPHVELQNTQRQLLRVDLLPLPNHVKEVKIKYLVITGD